METDRLRYFCAIVDSASLTKAAELLSISHSGLSKAMSALQDELGFKVLVPKGRGLELTEQGKVIYEQSQKILTMVNALQHQTQVVANFLRIALPEFLALAASEALTREITAGIAIEELDSGEIEARVLDRRLDFAFTSVPFPQKELEYLKVATVTLNSFSVAGCFRGYDSEKIPYVIPVHEMKDNPLSIKIRDGWNTNLFRHTPYRASSLAIALKMVRSKVCAIYTPNFLISYLNESESKEQQLTELNLSSERRITERTRRDIFLVKRHVDDETKIMKTVVKIIRKVCKN